jgi:hypothetical protein
VDRNALAGRTNNGRVPGCLLDFVGRNLGLVEQYELVGHCLGSICPRGEMITGAVVGGGGRGRWCQRDIIPGHPAQPLDRNSVRLEIC